MGNRLEGGVQRFSYLIIPVWEEKRLEREGADEKVKIMMGFVLLRESKFALSVENWNSD